MKRNNYTLLLNLVTLLFISSCATIIGGSKYNAHIVVSERPNAKIIYNNEVLGKGNATIKLNRNEINKFSFKVMEDGCSEQQYQFNSRTFRGWSFVGTILGWTGVVSGIPIPWGVIVDMATGSVWKPNEMERGISKMDYKNFKYVVNYTICENTKPKYNGNNSFDVVYLKNGSIVKGTIIEQIPNVLIKLQTKDENIFVFKMEEIERIVKEQVK